MPDDNQLYVVCLHHVDGRRTYAGKDSWENTEAPLYTCNLRSAKGKAGYWKRISDKPGHEQTNLTKITIEPARIEILSGMPCTTVEVPTATDVPPVNYHL